MADKKFGMRVKLRRMQLGLTQTQLAKKIGESSAFISDVEQGISFPRYERLIKLIDGLETSSDVLFQDVIKYPFRDRPSLLSDELRGLPPRAAQTRSRSRRVHHLQYKMDHATTRIEKFPGERMFCEEFHRTNLRHSNAKPHFCGLAFVYIYQLWVYNKSIK